MNKHFWRDILLLCAGIVIGSLVANLTAATKYFSWLSYGLVFGTDSPVTLNLGVLDITFGVSINITVSTIIFAVLIYVVGRKIIKL